MTISRHIVCDDCGGSFWHKVERRSDPNPDECPLCHNTGEQTAEVIDLRGKLHPNIAKMVEEGRGPATSQIRAKSAEQVYRQMESASAGRAELAAEHMGVDASEMAHMKITNLRDNLRAGDIAAKLPPNPVVEAMRNGQKTGFTQKPEVIPGQAMTPTGAASFAGIKSTVVAPHRARAAQLVRSGEVGRYTAPK